MSASHALYTVLTLLAGQSVLVCAYPAREYLRARSIINGTGSCLMVDVLSTVIIERPRSVVASFAADPDNATKWYVNIKSVEWKTPRPVRVGSRVVFIAGFLGRRLEYTYEVTSYSPSETMTMAAAEGPFPMETTYIWEELGIGRTRMSLRNRGAPSGFAIFVAPVISIAMRRANRHDLARLKSLLEQPGP